MDNRPKRLEQLLNEFEKYIPDHQQRNPKISAVNIAWQIDHSFKVIAKITTALENSDPSEYRPSVNFWWMGFRLLNWLPRGKGKAPKVVRPEGEIDSSVLESGLEQTMKCLEILTKLPPNAFFKHPYFGELNTQSAIRFLEIHSRHHLKICRDILRT